MSTFPERLKQLRLERDIKQTELAEIIEVSYRQFQNYEGAKGSSPKLETLIALADFFDVSLDYLVGRTDKR